MSRGPAHEPFSGGEDHGRCEQEREPGREPGRVLVAEAAPQSADHGDAGAADARERRGNLQHADPEAIADCDPRQACV